MKNEIDILNSLHNVIYFTKLLKIFKDKYNIYMVFEYVPGNCTIK
jgi:hypothetical protein